MTGILGIVVGFAGIYVPVLSFPGAVEAVGTVISGSALPTGFRSVAGMATLFCVMLGGIIAIGAVYVGLAFLLRLIFIFARINYPGVFGSIVTGLCFWFAFGLTYMIYNELEAHLFLVVGMFVGMAIISGLFLNMRSPVDHGDPVKHAEDKPTA